MEKEKIMNKRQMDQIARRNRAIVIKSRQEKESKFNTSYEKDSQGNLLHRVISERHDGVIPKGWHVHHCDYNKYNNKIDNLVQIPPELHDEIHRTFHLFNYPCKETILKVLLPKHIEKVNERKRAMSRKKDDVCKDMAREISRQLGLRRGIDRDRLLRDVVNIINNFENIDY